MYFGMHKYRALGFFCVLFLDFLIVLWEIKWCRFFACFDFAFCIVRTHPYCLVFRWFIWLLFCFLILNIYLCACLIFCGDFMLCLMLFCKQIAHIYISCFSAGCCRCHFLDLSDFLCAHFRFCWLHRQFILSTLLLASCFALLQLFLMFVWLVSCLLFFALQISWLHQFALARFRFFLAPLLIFLPPPYL